MNVLMPDYYNNPRQNRIRETSNVTYVLVTRYNMHINAYSRNSTSDERRQWALDRLPLFKKFCCPSVSSQDRDVEFKWVILADSEDIIVKDLLEEAVSHIPYAIVYACERDIDPQDNIRAAIRQAVKDSTSEFIATFRLDCDDAISRFFFKNIDIYLRSIPLTDTIWPTFALSFPFGVQIAGTQKYALNFPANPFIGLVDRLSDEMNHIYRYNHGYIYNDVRLLFLHTRCPMWAQVVHGANLMNSIYRDSLLFEATPSEMKRIFGFENG